MKDYQPDLKDFLKEDFSMYHARLNPSLLRNSFDGFFRVAAANRTIIDLNPRQHQVSNPIQVGNVPDSIHLARPVLLVEPQQAAGPNQAQGQVPSRKRKASESKVGQASAWGESGSVMKKAKRLQFGSLIEDPNVTWARARRHIMRKPKNEVRYTMEWAINQGLIPPKGKLWNTNFKKTRWTPFNEGGHPSENKSSDVGGVVGLQASRHGVTFSVPECGPPPVPVFPKKKKRKAASKPLGILHPGKLSARFELTKYYQHIGKHQTPGADAKLLPRHSLRMLDESRIKPLSEVDKETIEDIFEYQENIMEDEASEEDEQPIEEDLSEADEDVDMTEDAYAPHDLPIQEAMSDEAAENIEDASAAQEKPLEEVFEPPKNPVEEAFLHYRVSRKPAGRVTKTGVLIYIDTYDSKKWRMIPHSVQAEYAASTKECHHERTEMQSSVPRRRSVCRCYEAEENQDPTQISESTVSIASKNTEDMSFNESSVGKLKRKRVPDIYTFAIEDTEVSATPKSKRLRRE